MVIGKIVKSNGHTDYVCQVYRPGEVEAAPRQEDYAFGTFVRIPLEGGGALVGLIYDTLLFSPDFGQLGPRLSPVPELEVFAPDYLDERALLVGITAIGEVDESGLSIQGVPPLAASADAQVESMDDEHIRAFHRSEDGLQLAYAPQLLSQRSHIALDLLLKVVDRLSPHFPQQQALLAALKEDLLWRARIEPMGGSA